MENKIKKMIRVWKFLICYSFTLVLVGCENVRSGQLGTQPKRKKEETTPIFLPGNTKKAESQKNINIITLLIMLGLLSAQLTPVNSLLTGKCEETWNNQKDQIEEMRTLLYKHFSTFLFATENVNTTTRCSLEASNTSTSILEKCRNDCTNRLNKLLENKKIKELIKRYNSTSKNNPIVFYKIKTHNNNKADYPNVAYTYTKNNTVCLYGWRNAKEPLSYQSIPDAIKKIWKETNDNKKDRIKQLEELVARLMTIETNNLNLNNTLSKWCNNSNQDAAMGLIEAIEQIVDLIEIEEKLQNLENIEYDSHEIIRANKASTEEKNLFLKYLCIPYNKESSFIQKLKESVLELNQSSIDSFLEELNKHCKEGTPYNSTTSQDKSKTDEFVNNLLDMVIRQDQKDYLLKNEIDKTSWVKWFRMQHTGKQQQKHSWMRR